MAERPEERPSQPNPDQPTSLKEPRLFIASRVGMRLALAVFVTIVLVEATILVPSYLIQKQALVDRLTDGAFAAAEAALGAHGHDKDRDLRVYAAILAHGSEEIMGASLFHDDGSQISTTGDVPSLAFTATLDGTTHRRSDDGDWLDVAWLSEQSGLPFILIMRLDARGIDEELMAYVGRVMAIVLLLSVVVCATTMLIFDWMVLSPILRLGRRLSAVRQDPSNAAALLITVNRTDEIGELQTAFNHTVTGLSDTVTMLEDALNALKQAKADLEHKVVEREAAQEAAAEANHAKSQFLAAMSHELRTPLNAVLGFAQLLQSYSDNPLTEEQQDYIGHILTGGNHVLTLVNEVLDLSKIESGRMDLSMQQVQPIKIIDEAVAMAQPLAEQRGVSWKMDFHGVSDQTVSADPDRLKQVLLNLLSNAVKYNRDAGSVTIAVALADNDRIRMSVTDTGMGIPAEDHAGVFEPFSRLGMEGSTIEGTGIGLTISRELVESMGGKMDFASTVGQGTTFWLEFPIDHTGSPPA
jgi:signal transduction histidine kinase